MLTEFVGFVFNSLTVVWLLVVALMIYVGWFDKKSVDEAVEASEVIVLSEHQPDTSYTAQSA